jgi:putative ATPase
VYALTNTAAEAQTFSQQVQNLDSLEQPVILTGIITELPQLIAEHIEQPTPKIDLFDLVIGRNIFTRVDNKAALAGIIKQTIQPGGRLVLAEIIARHTQRLYRLVDLSRLDDDLARRVAAAEETIYANVNDSMVNWDGVDLQAALEHAGFEAVEIHTEVADSERHIGAGQVASWFTVEENKARPTYAQHLIAGNISMDELAHVKQTFERQLAGQVVNWQTTMVYIKAR